MVNSDKRQRHKDGHRTRVEEARIAQAKARRTRITIIVAFLVVVIVGGTILVSVTSDNGQKVTTSGTTTTTTPALDTGSTTAPDTTPTSPSVSIPAAASGAKVTGATPCPKADGSSPRTTSFAQAPPTCIDKAKTYTATIKTTEGDIVLALDTKQAPIAVNNFVVLARYHFYDGIAFHRLVPGFVDQTGDPTGTGSGGPGYDLPDENPTRKYAAGDVAMARAAKVSGSQIFFTIDPASLNSSPTYPILGTVTTGQDVVLRINKFGQADAAGTGAPTKLVTIQSVTIAET